MLIIYSLFLILKFIIKCVKAFFCGMSLVVEDNIEGFYNESFREIFLDNFTTITLFCAETKNVIFKYFNTFP